MEARRLRIALLFQHEELIGKIRAFDGSVLLLPKRLENKVWYENAFLFFILTCILSCFLFLTGLGEVRELMSHKQHLVGLNILI